MDAATTLRYLDARRKALSDELYAVEVAIREVEGLKWSARSALERLAIINDMKAEQQLGPV